jgi:PRTRC genetic system protein E
MFTEISNLLKEGEMLYINIMKSGNNLVVAVLPKSGEVKDPAAECLIPLNLKGSPEELDAGFLEAISKPVLQSTALLRNLSEYEKSAEKAAQESKAEKDRQEAISKKIKDAETLEKAGKLKEALALYSKVLEMDKLNQKVRLKVNSLKAKTMTCNDIFSSTPQTATATVEEPEEPDTVDDTDEMDEDD